MIPFWKKWLSYFFEFHIESAPGEINPHLYVSLKRGRYQLSTANAIYSHEELYLNFAKTFEQLDFSKLPGKEVLILGFGLGSIPIILEKLGHKDFEYTAIEIDENVIYLANKYILPKLSSKITFIASNAEFFMKQNLRKFDLICMDIFLDDKIPDYFQSKDFLELLNNALAPKGLLLYNCLAHTVADVKHSDEYYKTTFQPYFSKPEKLNIFGNYILTNRKDYFQ
jgi:spermidine synthase